MKKMNANCEIGIIARMIAQRIVIIVDPPPPMIAKIAMMITRNSGNATTTVTNVSAISPIVSTRCWISSLCSRSYCSAFSRKYGLSWPPLVAVVTTATSGGQLKPYFLLKAEQFERENKLEQLQRVETMGLLAETFVTVVVAFPLFLVIIIAIFAVIGGGGQFMIDLLWGIVGAMIPLAQFGFIFFMYSLAQEMI